MPVKVMLHGQDRFQTTDLSGLLKGANGQITVAEAGVDYIVPSNLDFYVPIIRTINGKALNTDILLGANDVGAYPITGGIVNGPVIATSTVGNSYVDALFGSYKMRLNMDQNAGYLQKISADDTDIVSILAIAATGIEGTATFFGNITGNANTASSLALNTRMDYGWDGLQYFNASLLEGSAPNGNDAPASEWWHILRANHGNINGYHTDLALPFHLPSMYYKRVVAGQTQQNGWVKILDRDNYTEFTVTKDGVGATGTWNINIIGAATILTNNATALATVNLADAPFLHLEDRSSGQSSDWYCPSGIPRVHSYGGALVDRFYTLLAKCSDEGMAGFFDDQTIAPTITTNPLRYNGTFRATQVRGMYFSDDSDLAEKYHVEGDIEPGELVMISADGSLRRNEYANNNKVLGIVSTAPAMVLGEEVDGVPIALSGRIPVKIIGKIEPGDYLCGSSCPGALQKADDQTPRGAVVAQALEAGEDTTILALAMRM